LRITVYRLTDGSPLDVTVLRRADGFSEIPTKQLSGISTRLFIRSAPATPVKWADALTLIAADASGLSVLRYRSSSAVLLVKHSKVVYALAFGSGFHAIDPARIERGFGVRVTANAIAADRIKSADTRGLNRDGRSSKVILPVASALGDLGIDPTEEWVRRLSGAATAADFATTAAGADSLRLSIKDFKLTRLESKLKQIDVYWKSKEYKRQFGFLDYFVQLDRRDPLVAELDAELTDLVLSESSDVYFAAPEPFEQLDVDMYRIRFRKQFELDELSQEAVYGALAELSLPDDDALRRVAVDALNVDGELIDKSYKLYDYVQAELVKEDSRYVLSAGIWFRVAASYVEQVNKFVAGIEDVTDDLQLPKWSKSPKDQSKYLDEGKYNEALAASSGYVLMDKDNLHLGSYRKIEICDLLTAKKQMLCVKRATRSSTLSHLFAQGSVSVALMHEGAYQAKLLGALHTLDASATWGNPGDWKVVYAIGTSKPGPLANSLFFFSQVNLMTHVQDIRSRSVKVALARIDM
jgi:uncharacterized protein (TIGR04141 family)